MFVCHLLLILLVGVLLLHTPAVEGRTRKNMRKDDSEGKDMSKEDNLKREMDYPQNQNPRKKIMFWRPQKVGSVRGNNNSGVSISLLLSYYLCLVVLQSTVVNILNTYSFRHELTVSPKGSKNSFCHFIGKCVEEIDISVSSTKSRNTLKGLSALRLRPVDSGDIARTADISVQHQLCNLDGDLTQQALPCAFRSSDDLSSPIKQLTLVREPVSRAISVYYFWGELFKLKKSASGKKNKKVNQNETRVTVVAFSKIMFAFALHLCVCRDLRVSLWAKCRRMAPSPLASSTTTAMKPLLLPRRLLEVSVRVCF
jgi:hypothetical protein